MLHCNLIAQPPSIDHNGTCFMPCPTDLLLHTPPQQEPLEQVVLSALGFVLPQMPVAAVHVPGIRHSDAVQLTPMHLSAIPVCARATRSCTKRSDCNILRCAMKTWRHKHESTRRHSARDVYGNQSIAPTDMSQTCNDQFACMQSYQKKLMPAPHICRAQLVGLIRCCCTHLRTRRSSKNLWSKLCCQAWQFAARTCQ